MIDINTDLQAVGNHFKVSCKTIGKLRVYQDLLINWNNSINLVSKKSLRVSAVRHFADSLQLWSLRESFETWVDIGSGAGFPGMVLAILSENKGSFHFVESDARKCAFIRNVSRETNTPITVHTERIETFDKVKADVVSARALASVEKLFEYTEKILKPDSICLYLKGRNCNSELEEVSPSWRYKVEKYASKTDENGTILRIKDIVRIGK